jgi:hypothetical protein
MAFVENDSDLYERSQKLDFTFARKWFTTHSGYNWFCYRMVGDMLENDDTCPQRLVDWIMRHELLEYIEMTDDQECPAAGDLEFNYFPFEGTIDTNTKKRALLLRRIRTWANEFVEKNEERFTSAKVMICKERQVPPHSDMWGYSITLVGATTYNLKF